MITDDTESISCRALTECGVPAFRSGRPCGPDREHRQALPAKQNRSPAKLTKDRFIDHTGPTEARHNLPTVCVSTPFHGIHLQIHLNTLARRLDLPLRCDATDGIARRAEAYLGTVYMYILPNMPNFMLTTWKIFVKQNLAGNPAVWAGGKWGVRGCGGCSRAVSRARRGSCHGKICTAWGRPEGVPSWACRLRRGALLEQGDAGL